MRTCHCGVIGAAAHSPLLCQQDLRWDAHHSAADLAAWFACSHMVELHPACCSKAPGMVLQIWLNPSGHSDDSLQDPSGAELHFAVSDAEIDISEPIADALELGLPIKSVCGLPDCIVQGRCWHCVS